jgi:hypothetical protein
MKPRLFAGRDAPVKHYIFIETTTENLKKNLKLKEYGSEKSNRFSIIHLTFYINCRISYGIYLEVVIERTTAHDS